ncbi:MAG TPA: glycoside hydrolase, partial [Dehalococcoidia bacterium]|nr:glycoside hydrolase [Dehalococcoidia bacterium]
ELGNPIPRSFQSAAEFILNSKLRKAVSGDSLDLERIRSILDETQTWKVELDTEGLSYLLQQTLEGMMARLVAAAEDIVLLKELLAAAEMLRKLPFPVDLWKVQNLYHEMLMSTYPEFQTRAERGDEAAQEWLNQFVSLAQQLSIRVG